MAAAEPLRPLILICDDEPPLRELQKAVLGSGYRYVEAANTSEAEAQLAVEPPALIVLDVMLPGKSGLEFLRELRESTHSPTIPVVVVSAWQSATDQQAATDAGADAFLGKPFDPDAFARVVSDLVSA
jgi:DNA-binding response OmpR family regulator